MGTSTFDQYTLLHFATGVIAYFWGISFSSTVILHTLFEGIENTDLGMRVINTFFKDIWPGGKSYPDSFNNSIIGDTIGVIFGWLLAYYLDILGLKYGWYEPHLVS
ncbi:MAG: hypothetical protein WD512_07680 [Candidatus Paceibacterota bacterium]